MVSSKFSRRPVVQQPPPVCKSKKVPIIPPTHGGTIHATATYDGLTMHGHDVHFEENVDLEPDMYSTQYSYFDPIFNPQHVHFDKIVDPQAEPHPSLKLSSPGLFRITFGTIGPQLYTGYFWWLLPLGDTARADFDVVEIPDAPPVDTGIMTADSTTPTGQSATCRLYTSA